MPPDLTQYQSYATPDFLAPLDSLVPPVLQVPQLRSGTDAVPPVSVGAAPAYAELHALSNFSFLNGASHPEELVARAVELQYEALALTDTCSLAGVVRAYSEARERGLQLIIGAEFELEDRLRLILLACNRNGYGNLAELITRARRRSLKGEYRLELSDLHGGVAHCLALLASGWRPASALSDQKLAFTDGARVAASLFEPRISIPSITTLGWSQERVDWLSNQFKGRLWLLLEQHLSARDRVLQDQIQDFAEGLSVPLAAAGDVHMHAAQRQHLQDVLTATRLKCRVSDLGAAAFANVERCMRSREEIARLYPAQAIEQTLEIASRCHFSLSELRYEYPKELVPEGVSAGTHLHDLTMQGAAQRYPAGVPREVRKLLDHELALIGELQYEPYFLTVHDLVRFARSRDILCQGRGSAANSAVCFCLGITEVDPSRMSMLFERFVSKERDEPPDIDVDFEHERREEVIQYIYSQYGRERAALAATVVTYRPKSAVRDVANALGFERMYIDRLCSSLTWWDDKNALAERLKACGLDPRARNVRQLLVLARELIGFPRHLSQHTGGFVIAQGKVSRLVPIENAAMADRTVIQWDKDDLESLGLLKVDVLALGILSAIRRAIALINGRCKKQSEPSLRLASIPAEDPDVYAMIQRADTMGVFQIESRAQMAMLPRMRPACFYDLVIEVAIVRPGPIQGGMVHPYLRRRQGLEAVRYPSKEVKQVLQRTLGVPIFQEQAMQLAVVAAGFSPGEADQLRRAMATFRRRGGVERFRHRLVEGMRERGYSEQFAQQLFKQIEGFGEYGFPESHSASFALLVYVSAWLKCHEPAAFCCALLNSQPMGFYAPAQLVQDARRHGVRVFEPDVLHSEWDSTLEPDDKGADGVRLGLRILKGLSESAAERLLTFRRQQPERFGQMQMLSGSARRIEMLLHETALSRRDIAILSDGGALASLAGHRRRAHWAVLGADGQAPPIVQRAGFTEALPLLPEPEEGQSIVDDYRTRGFSLRRHPLALLRSNLKQRRYIDAAQVRTLEHGRFARAAGLVINRQRPATASGVLFITLEDESGYINLVCWPRVVDTQRAAILGARLMGVSGKIERESEVVHLVVHQVEDMSAMLGQLLTRSRDFR